MKKSISGNYLDPKDATRIRIFEEYDDAWSIDAADESGEYSDLCWTHYDGELLTKEKALAVAHEFAAEYGRPDLANRVFWGDTLMTPPKRERIIDMFQDFMCRLARPWFGRNS